MSDSGPGVRGGSARAAAADPSDVPGPEGDRRWRCGACGNLTRFDVTRRSRVVDFVHLDLAGRGRIEERTVLDEVVEQVRCRWCDRADRIETVPRTDVPEAPEALGAPQDSAG